MIQPSIPRSVRRKPEQDARCITGHCRPKKVSAPEPVANGFLRHSFQPCYTSKASTADNKKEQDFLCSLAKLQAEYSLPDIDLKGKPYPYNVLFAIAKVREQLNAFGRELELSVQQDNAGSVFLLTRESYSPGTTLYYIPILPLYRLMKDKKQRRSAELLLSVCTYLYHSAGIPYYRDEESGLGYYYGWVTEYYSELDMEYASADDEENYPPSDYTELRQAQYYGDVMHRRIYSTYQLDSFEQRIARFVPKDEFEWSCYKVAQKGLALLNQYPNKCLFHYMELETEKYEDCVIHAEQYISFVAETEGGVYEHISQMVNSEFGECGEMESPNLVKCFDNNFQPEGTSLEFEYRLFPLINDLCKILNNLP